MPSLSSFWTALDWSQWVYGLLAGAIGGGSSAVTSGIATAVLDPKDYAFGGNKSFKLMLTVFILNAVTHAFMYLKQHPLPDAKTATQMMQDVKEIANVRAASSE